MKLLVTGSDGMVGYALRQFAPNSTIFISRKNNNWQTILLDSLDRYNMPFKTDKYKYLTCSNVNDEDCWQHIIYCGDESKLPQWERK